MSRIGNKPISLEQGTTVTVNDCVVTVKGAKGELNQTINKHFDIRVEDNKVFVNTERKEKNYRALHGLYRSLIANHVEGVTKGYEKKLELVGVGFKATNQGNVLELSLGYSHAIFFQVPNELKVVTETLKGKNPTITLTSINKELIGEVCAKIRGLRKVEPFKGKGIRFLGEEVRRKAGKTGTK